MKGQLPLVLLLLAGCSGSSSGRFGVETSSSGGGSTGSSGTSSGSSGSTGGDTGGSDAGTFASDAGRPSFYCRIVQGVRTVDIAAADGGCSVRPACEGTPVALEPEIHVPEPRRVDYLTEPPPSGPHWPCWAPWGGSHASTALPAERFVHNLEHGGVVLLYRCVPDAGLVDGGACAQMAAPLLDFARDGGPAAPAGDRRYLVTARPQLPTGFAALAWGWRLELDALDTGTLDCFAQAHLGAAPEDFGGDPDPTGCPQSYAP